MDLTVLQNCPHLTAALWRTFTESVAILKTSYKTECPMQLADAVRRQLASAMGLLIHLLAAITSYVSACHAGLPGDRVGDDE
jgi:hypothetical protein